MTDRIRIEDLRVRTVLGVHGRERAAKQEVLVSLEIEGDLGAAARSDALGDAVDYEEVARAVGTLAAESSFHLAEALASAVADLVLGRPRVAAVTVTVAKPSALPLARSVAVILRRERAAAETRKGRRGE